jgi:hypothetical protein
MLGRARGLAVILVAAACSSDPAPDPNAGSAPFRRLTRSEYNNTIRDLLGDTSQPARLFPPEEHANGFGNNSEVLGVTQLLAENYLTTAEALAERYTREVDDILPGCRKTDGEPCAVAFIRDFGKRAFRRPLTDAEVEQFTSLWRAGAKAQHFDEGVEMVLQAMLQSPHFLYRVEHGEPGGPVNLRRPTSWEMASRLSYLMWSSMPDEELFAAAEAGTLTDPAEIEAQARRMFVDPRTRATVGSFFDQWLELDLIDGLSKDPSIFPRFKGGLRPHLRTEIQTFIDHVVWEGSGELAELLTAPYTFMNKPLADFYGVTGPTGDAFVRVELEPERHAGILTQGGILAAFAKPNQTSPIHRGKWVRERLLCETLTPPPPEIETQPPDLDPTLTTRERFFQHRDDPFCAKCHELMDPIGLAFEHFDGAGLWRDDEHGLAIDASGEIVGTDVSGEFYGAVELARKLATSAQVQDCVSLSMFRYAYGRTESMADASSLHHLRKRFGRSNDLRELFLSLTETDAFRYLPATSGGAK